MTDIGEVGLDTSTLQELLTCFLAWEPSARVVGDVRACDAVIAVDGALLELDRLRAENEALKAKVGVEAGMLRQIAEGLDRVRYPGSGDSGGREWVSDLGVYLRGEAAGIISVAPDVMRWLESHKPGPAEPRTNKEGSESN